MKIVFFTFKSSKYQYPGGDLLIENLIQDLRLLGNEVSQTEDLEEVKKADFVVLARTCIDHDRYYYALKLLDKPYAFIPFHDDHIKSDRVQKAFFCYLSALALRNDHPLTLEALLEQPELIYYNDFVPDNLHVINYPIYKDASFCMANTPTEKATIERDCRSAKVETIYLAPGQFSEGPFPYSDSFLKLVPPLSKGSYILQVGRLEMRKNQLGTIFATRNLDIPLVLLSSDLFEKGYEYAKSCVAAIKKYRKAPTYIISHHLKPYEDKHLKIIQLSEDQRINKQMLASAYQNAGLYLHPAFSELPGFVYLEAIKMGIPVVASNWTTINDYFNAFGESISSPYIEYVVPYDIDQIENKASLLFGKNFSPLSHRILSRKNLDVAQDFFNTISKYK